MPRDNYEGGVLLKTLLKSYKTVKVLSSKFELSFTFSLILPDPDLGLQG